MRIFAPFLVTLTATYVAAFTIMPPENGWAKTGTKRSLICTSDEPVLTCSWDTPYGSNYPFREGYEKAESGRLEYVSSTDYECGIFITNVEARDDGVWSCNVGIGKDGEMITSKGKSRLNIAQKPKSVALMEPHNGDVINSTTAVVEVKCKAIDAMPKPTFTWTIDGQLLENVKTNTEQEDQSWINTLYYIGDASHHNKTLTCSGEHIAFEDGEVAEASTVVHFTATQAVNSREGVGIGKMIGFALIAVAAFIGIFIGPCCVYRILCYKKPSIVKDETTEQVDVEETKTKADEKETQDSKADEKDEEPEENQEETKAGRSLTERVWTFLRLKKESASTLTDEADAEVATTEEGPKEEKEDEMDAKDKEVEMEEAPQEAIQKATRFSVWKYIKLPFSGSKKQDKDVEMGQGDVKEKEKAAFEEEGEKETVELEPEDKPENEQEDVKPSEEKGDAPKDEEESKTPNNTPV